jgi:hypothetical protein
MKHILFFFVDGVGLGPQASSNPLSEHDGEGLARLAGGQRWCRPFTPKEEAERLARPLDATLGVEGLPQSGTGQATLFTGTNCAEIVGRHFGPFPHSRTHPILDRQNVFHQVRSLADAGLPVAFANAFPPQYFDASRRRSTVTTYCCEATDVRLRTLTDLRAGRALAADLSGVYWRDHLGLSVPERRAAEAADVLWATARRHAFTLFEYFLTDKAGHARIDTPAGDLFTHLDRVFSALLGTLDPARDTLVVTSDHGNVEDLSHTQHTRNPVPLFVHGWAAPFFTAARDLADVTPALVEALRAARSDAPAR